MSITAKFIGELSLLSGEKKQTFKCTEGSSITEFINKISLGKHALKNSLIDTKQANPKPNALILVNGKEISVLNGLATKINAGDEVVFIPVVHGG